MVRTIVRRLRSFRLTLALLVFFALFSALAAWGRGGGDSLLRTSHPFQSWPFFIACGLLFLNTLSCSAHRAAWVAALWRGVLPSVADAMPHPGHGNLRSFLTTRHGFRARGAILFRNRSALWGGFVLHLGVLVLIAGIAVQQAYHDTGAFEVAEGEGVDLPAPGVVFERTHGPLAPGAPPTIRVTLVAFDPFLHQSGYAPDRGSRVLLERPGLPPVQVFIDRASGVAVGTTTIFQAIPSGLALLIEVPGFGVRALHLRADTATSASSTCTAPGGATVRMGVRAGRALNDSTGTGSLSIWEEQDGATRRIAAGAAFPFGAVTARLVGVTRWAGFTFSRSPGMPAVYSGFALLLLGSVMLTFPTGVAKLDDDQAIAGWVWVSRGRETLLEEWHELGDTRHRATTSPPPVLGSLPVMTCRANRQRLDRHANWGLADVDFGSQTPESMLLSKEEP